MNPPPFNNLIAESIIVSGASFKRGKSRQDYETPKCFIDPVVDRFGPLSFDLAASASNTKAPRFFSVEDNSLIQKWCEIGGTLWLNPPFDNISPWAEKCAIESRRGSKILFLTPASIGANWFRDFVHRRSLVIALNGRIPFDPKNPTWGYPKDCMLSCFGFDPGFEVWTWRTQ